MNSIYLLAVTLCFLALGYRYYLSFIAAKVLSLNDANVMPAHLYEDGHEYMPVKKWLLFGHHFAAIAGAGPLVGPVLAAQYGWGPGFLWILLGSVFAGAIHDMIILYASVKHKGQSLNIIVKEEIGTRAGFVMSIITFFTIIMALAGLAAVVVNALANNPWGVFSIAMTIPIAMVLGFFIFRGGSIISGSLFGFIAVVAMVFVGALIPGSTLESYFTFNTEQVSLLLPVYGSLAAILPVWLLLVPRDYLSSYIKVGVIFALIVGVLWVQPRINLHFVTEFVNGGPIVPGPVWPYVFTTIACGAISGFHALVCSGTTPKMIDRETQILPIAGGSMLVEAVVGVVALIAVASLHMGDYFAINAPAATHAALAKLYPVVNLKELSALVGIDVSGRPGGAVSLAVGMANVFSAIGGLKSLMKFWYQFAIMFEALFIMTVIDAGTRVARYFLQELFGKSVHRKFSDNDWWPGIIVTGILVSVIWGTLLYNGSISVIWPIFGATNQLLATIALFVGAAVVIKVSGQRRYSLVCLIPAVFMAITVIWVDVENMLQYIHQGSIFAWTLLGVSIIILLCTMIVLKDILVRLRALLRCSQ